MTRFAMDLELLDALEAVTKQLDTLGEDIVFIGECPNKYNDADQDDIWYAVQAGKTFWEQSHFFKYSSEPTVRERSSFTLDASEDQILEAGSSIASDQIALLRGQLRQLQKDNWRGMCGWHALTALVHDLGQWWLVLEEPNITDGEVFTWDDDGFFAVGEVERIDQALGGKGILTFKTVRDDALGRLDGRSKAFFHPVSKRADDLNTLSRVLWLAVLEVRHATKEAVALKSGKSKGSHSLHAGSWSAMRPTCFCAALRPNEGDFRKPTNGIWPKYQQNFQAKPTEYSDLAKSLHTTLGKLEDHDWRKLFSEAYGEALDAGQTLAIFVDDDLAALVRENTAFRIDQDGLSYFGVIDYPDCRLPAEILSEMRALS